MFSRKFRSVCWIAGILAGCGLACLTSSGCDSKANAAAHNSNDVAPPISETTARVMDRQYSAPIQPRQILVVASIRAGMDVTTEDSEQWYLLWSNNRVEATITAEAQLGFPADSLTITKQVDGRWVARSSSGVAVTSVSVLHDDSEITDTDRGWIRPDSFNELFDEAFRSAENRTRQMAADAASSPEVRLLAKEALANYISAIAGVRVSPEEVTLELTNQFNSSTLISRN